MVWLVAQPGVAGFIRNFIGEKASVGVFRPAASLDCGIHEFMPKGQAPEALGLCTAYLILRQIDWPELSESPLLGIDLFDPHDCAINHALRQARGLSVGLAQLENLTFPRRKGHIVQAFNARL